MEYGYIRVSSKEHGRILFFDTDEYYRTGKMDGVSVKTVDLNINIGG